MGKTVMEIGRERFPDQKNVPSNSPWTQERILEAVQKWSDEHGYLPSTTDFSGDPSLPGFGTIRNHFGIRYSEFASTYFSGIPLKAPPEEPAVGLTEEECERAIASFIEANGYAPTASSLTGKGELPSHRMFVQVMGKSVKQYLAEKYPDVRYGRTTTVSQKHCIEAYRQFVEKNQRLPISADFVGGDLPNIMTFTKRMQMTPQQYGQEHYPHLSIYPEWTKEACIEALDRFITKRKRLPFDRDFTLNNGLPTRTVFHDAVGVDHQSYLTEHYGHMPPQEESLTNRRHWTREACIEAVERKMRELPVDKPVLMKQIYRTKGMPSFSIFQQNVGVSYREYIEEHFPDRITMRWSKEKCIQRLEDYIARCKAENKPLGNPASGDGMPSQGIFSQYVGCSYRQYLLGLKIDTSYEPRGERGKPVKWNRESCIRAVENRVDQLEGHELHNWDFSVPGIPMNSTFRKFVGMSIMNYCRERYPHLKFHSSRSSDRWDRESCIAAVDEHILTLGKQDLRTTDFIAPDIPDPRVFQKYVGMTIMGYCKEYHPQIRTCTKGGYRAWNREACIASVDEHMRSLKGKLVAVKDIRGPDMPSHATFRKHTGISLAQYCREQHPDKLLPDIRHISKWTRESCIASVERFFEQHGRRPKSKDIRDSSQLPHWEVFRRLTGQRYQEYFDENHPEPRDDKTAWDWDSCLSAADDFVRKNGRLPLHSEMNKDHHLASYSTFQAQTGISYPDYFKEKYPELSTTGQKWSRESCIDAIESRIHVLRRLNLTQHDLQVPGMPGHAEFRKHTGMTPLQYFREHHPEIHITSQNSKQVRWDANRCMEELEWFLQRHGRIPSTDERKAESGLPSPATFEKNVGKSYAQYIQEHHPELATVNKGNRKWDRALCIKTLETFLKEHGRAPGDAENRTENGLPSPKAFHRNVGMSYAQYIREQYPELAIERHRNRTWNRELCIEALEGYVERQGRAPAISDYKEKNGLPSYMTFRKQVGMSGFAYIQEHHAELPDSKKIVRWSKDDCVAALDNFILQAGRAPKYDEINAQHNLPQYAVFLKHVGQPYSQYIKEHYPALHTQVDIKKWDKEKCVAALTEFIRENSRAPLQTERLAKHGLANDPTFRKHVGQNYTAYIRDHYPELSKRQALKRWDRESCVAALTNFIERNHRAPWGDEFRASAGLPAGEVFQRHVGVTIQQYVASYFPQMARSRAVWDRAQCISALGAFIREKGYAPYYEDCTASNGLPTREIFVKNVGMPAKQYAEQHMGQLLETHRKERPQRIRAPRASVWNRERCRWSAECGESRTLRASRGKSLRSTGPGAYLSASFWLYPNLEYACASGMSFLCTDTKGDLQRFYAKIAHDYYGYAISCIDLRNPLRSSGNNMLHLVNKYMDVFLDSGDMTSKAKAERYAKVVAKTIINSSGDTDHGQNAFFYDSAEGLLTAVILLLAEYLPPQVDEETGEVGPDCRHIVSVYKLTQELLGPSKVKGKNRFQVLMEKLPSDHKARWFAGSALNTAEQAMASVLSTVLSRLNSFLDTEMEQILCNPTDLDAETFCSRKSAVFVTMPEEDNSRYFLVSLIIQQLYREILTVADANGGKLNNRVMFYCDELGTLPKIESFEMMLSAGRSRRISIIPMIQSYAQLQKNYGSEGAEIIVDNAQITIFSGFAPNSETSEKLSKALGSRTVLSGSVSRGKNDPSQSLQMMERPLMTSDELKGLPKGQFIVMKTGAHPMKTTLRLFFEWGITFGEEYVISENAYRKVVYADKQDLEDEILFRHHAEDDDPFTPPGSSPMGSGGMAQTPIPHPTPGFRPPIPTPPGMEGKGSFRV